jgi:hypothetical protein
VREVGDVLDGLLRKVARTAAKAVQYAGSFASPHSGHRAGAPFLGSGSGLCFSQIVIPSTTDFQRPHRQRRWSGGRGKPPGR